MLDYDAIPTVKVDVSKDGPYLLVTPRDETGTEVFRRVVDGMPDTLRWNFQGSKYNDSHTKDLLIGTYFACGGSQRLQTDRKPGRPNVSYYVYDGAVMMYFDLTEVEDRETRYAILEYGYLNEVIMEPDSSATCLRVRAGTCKVCSGPLIRFSELEWKVCDSCSAKCEHSYKEGIGQAAGHLAYLPYCTLCGRGDPRWKPDEDPVVDVLNVVSKGGLNALVLNHPGGSSTVITPK